MKKYHGLVVLVFAIGWAAAAQAGIGPVAPTPSAAPAPMIGAGIAYLAMGGTAGAAWLLVRTLGKRLRKRKPQNDE